ncbi:TBC domain-containing kinase, partial [Paramuricea clavata]
ADVWSLGIVLTELVLGELIWSNLTKKSDIKQILGKMLALFMKEKETGENPFCFLLREHGAVGKLEDISPDLRSFIECCLTIKHSKRKNPVELVEHQLFLNCRRTEKVEDSIDIFPAVFRSGELELPVDSSKETTSGDDLLQERPIREIYHLWTLAGGDVFAELKKHDLIKTFPPVCNMPNVILHGGDTLGVAKDRNLLLDDSVVCLSLERVREQLSHVEPTAYYPLLVEKDPCAFESSEMKSLPVVIRERDVEYQFRRIVIFQRLLEGYPYTRDKIIKEARVDIPPLLRDKIWAALLNVT